MAALSSVTTSIVPGTVTQVKPQATESRSLWDIFVKWCSEASFVKNLVKAFNYGSFWVRHAVSMSPELSAAPQMGSAMETLKAAGETGKDIKNLIGAAEVPEKATRLVATVRKVIAEPSWAGVAQVGADAGQVVNSLYDGFELSTRFIPIDPAMMRNITAVNHAATLFSAGKGAIDELGEMAANKLHEATNSVEAEQEKNKLIFSMLNLAKLVSYVAVGVMGLSSFFFGIVFAPWAFPAALTTALVFTFGGYFFDKIVDPKNKNPKPELPPVSTVTV
jgi:hypothetical protein